MRDLVSELLVFYYKSGVGSSVWECITLCILEQAASSKFPHGKDLRGRRNPRAIVGYEFMAVVLAYGASSLSYSKV